MRGASMLMIALTQQWIVHAWRTAAVRMGIFMIDAWCTGQS